MLNEIKDNLSTFLNCNKNCFELEGIHIIRPNEHQSNACGEHGLLAISTTNGVVIQCDQLYNEELKNVYKDTTKLDFFELNNLSFLESLVCENNKLLSGPYLVLHAQSQNLINNKINNDGYKIEIRLKNNKDLYRYDGFDNALSYDDTENDEISLIVWKNLQPISIATARHLHGDLYNIGINVLPSWRRKGIGVLALTMLTNEVINKGKIPNYSVSIANTASINLALKVGYKVSYTTIYTV